MNLALTLQPGIKLVRSSVAALLACLLMLGLSALYVSAGDTTPVMALFAGLAPAVLAIVAAALAAVRAALIHPR